MMDEEISSPSSSSDKKHSYQSSSKESDSLSESLSEGDNEESLSGSNETESSPNESESESESESNSESESESESEDNPQPSLEYELIAPINDSSSSKRLVKTKYQREGAVVADAVATDFGADPTGKTDSSTAIQAAINSVSTLGGGTVFLPLGRYLVTKTITLPQYVSLVGDWNTPDKDNTDEGFDYGTVILARPSAIGSASPKDKPLFSLSENTGLDGLTFYYPEQSPSGVKKYGYTVYADCPSTATLKNLTFINSAYGIGVSLGNIQNELVNLENIYGTFLYNAIRHNATTDVGFYNNINISAKYWLNASSEFKCNDESALNEFVSKSLEAIILGDLDDQLISNVTVEGGKIGIKFTSGIRAGLGFWGLVYNANIDCQTGVYADLLNSVSGVVFTDSSVGAVENNSPVGCVKMSNSAYEAQGTGKTIQEHGEIAKNVAISPLSLSFSSSQRLFIANNLKSGGSVDNSSKLQSVLDEVGEEGGIVVIPNGIYKLSSSVTVPKNVEIRSTQSVFTRTSSNQTGKNGVVFLSYVSGTTLILKENAGVAGVRIWHARNDFLSALIGLTSGSYSEDVSVKADGEGAYAYMNESVGAYVAYDFSSCDNHVLKSNYGISYLNFIKAGGKNGVITQCLANPNFMTRSNLHNYFDSSLSNKTNWQKMASSGEVNDDFAILRDDILRTYTKMVRLENAENQIAFNVFCYGHAGLFDMVSSSSTLINTSLDYIKGSNFVYELSGGSCDIVGSLRVYGTSIKVNSGRLTAYGRIAFGEIREQAYDSDISLEDKIYYVSENAKRKTLFNCDYYSTAFNVSPNYNSDYVIEGVGSWKWKTTTLEGKFSSVDLSEYKNGYLHFYVYCSDITKMGYGQIEITSSSNCDVNEANWNIDQYITKTGWNEIWLEFNTAGSTGGEVDLSNVNYFRIYILDSTATFYIDNIEVLTD